MMRHIIDILEEAIPNCNLDNANGFCILKPGFSEYTDEFIGLLGANGWKVLKKINKKLSKNEAQELYKITSHRKKNIFKGLSSEDIFACKEVMSRDMESINFTVSLSVEFENSKKASQKISDNGANI